MSGAKAVSIVEGVAIVCVLEGVMAAEVAKEWAVQGAA